MARSRSLACSTPTMFSGSSSIERQAGVRRLQGLGDQLARRQVGVDHRRSILRWTMTSRDVHVRQVQHAAQHPPVAALHRALGVVVLDRPADLLVGGQDVGSMSRFDAEQAAACWRTIHWTAKMIGPRTRTDDQHRAGQRRAPRRRRGRSPGSWAAPRRTPPPARSSRPWRRPRPTAPGIDLGDERGGQGRGRGC